MFAVPFGVPLSLVLRGWQGAWPEPPIRPLPLSYRTGLCLYLQAMPLEPRLFSRISAASRPARMPLGFFSMDSVNSVNTPALSGSGDSA